jgi:exosome complex protein LRP1
MVERAEYDKTLKELGSEEEEDLEVFGDVEDEDVDVTEERPITKGKEMPGKRRDAPSGIKRRRPVMDPFAGQPFQLVSFFFFCLSS